MEAWAPGSQTTSTWPPQRTSRPQLPVESFQTRMSAASVVGTEFLGTGEQNTHLHKLAFQMGMLLMQDLASRAVAGGRCVPGTESRTGQRPGSPLRHSCWAELTRLVRRTAGKHKKPRSPAHVGLEDGQRGG